jgi:hypothetical protein
MLSKEFVEFEWAGPILFKSQIYEYVEECCLLRCDALVRTDVPEERSWLLLTLFLAR